MSSLWQTQASYKQGRNARAFKFTKRFHLTTTLAKISCHPNNYIHKFPVECVQVIFLFTYYNGGPTYNCVNMAGFQPDSLLVCMLCTQNCCIQVKFKQIWQYTKLFTHVDLRTSTVVQHTQNDDSTFPVPPCLAESVGCPAGSQAWSSMWRVRLRLCLNGRTQMVHMNLGVWPLA